MESVPDWQRWQIMKDIEHLRILGMLYYVVAGLGALGAMVSLFYVGMGVLAGTVISQDQQGGGAEAGLAIGGLFAGIGCFLFFFNAGLAYLQYLAGQGLRSYSNKTAILIAAGITCMGVPLGTILGVFTFIVMGRPTVARMFEAGGPPAFEDGPMPPNGPPPTVPSGPTQV